MGNFVVVRRANGLTWLEELLDYFLFAVSKPIGAFLGTFFLGGLISGSRVDTWNYLTLLIEKS